MSATAETTVTVELSVHEARALARSAGLLHGLLEREHPDRCACALTAGAMKIETALVCAGEIEA